jgi:hypothetical protein
MESPKNWNGSQTLIGTQHGPGNASTPVTPMLPSLGFSKSTHAPQHLRRDHYLGRHDRWDKGCYSQKEILQRRALSSPDAGRGVGAFGNLVLVGFIFIAIGMAGVALHQEQRLSPQERQLLHQQR